MFVIIVDGDERIRESLTELLEAHGMHSPWLGGLGARTGCDKESLQRIVLDRLVHVLAFGRHFVNCREIAANACAVANRSALRLSIA
jgi:hypothetical protein